MAKTKCPECGRQASDKARACPHCGAALPGRTVTCVNCGATYPDDSPRCPSCQSPAPGNAGGKGGPGPGKRGRKRKRAWAVALAICLAAALAGAWAVRHFHEEGLRERELGEYGFARTSWDRAILQSYLDNFKDAPEGHVAEIRARLQAIVGEETDWENALASGRSGALQEFMGKYPRSIHEREAREKVDSIDWEQCLAANTEDAYRRYMEGHGDGYHYDEALAALKRARDASTPSADEARIAAVFRNFFSAISSRDGAGLVADVAETLELLGKKDATRDDVVSFMNKLYRRDVAGMAWGMPDRIDVQAVESGDGERAYRVDFRVTQDVTMADDAMETNAYMVHASLDSRARITRLEMGRIRNDDNGNR